MHTGLYTGDSGPSDQDMFIVEKKAFSGLCDSLVKACSCHWEPAPWRLAKFIQVWVERNFCIWSMSSVVSMYIARITLLVSLSAAHDVVTQTFGARYLVNQK